MANHIPESKYVHSPRNGSSVMLTELPSRPTLRRTSSGKWQVIARAGSRTRVKIGNRVEAVK